MLSVKKQISWLLVFVMLLQLIPAVALSADAADDAMTITVGQATGNVGDTVTLTVDIANNTGFSGFSFNVVYDTTALTLTGIAQGAVLNAVDTSGLSTNVSRNVATWATTTNTTGDGELMTLTFTINAESGSWPVTLEATDFFSVDSSGNFLDCNAQFVAGSVSLAEPEVAPEATFSWYGRNVRLQDLIKIGMYFKASSTQTIQEVGALLWTADQYEQETDFTVNSTLAQKFENLEPVSTGLYAIETDGIYAQYLDNVYYMIPYAVTEYGTVYGDVMGGENYGCVLGYASTVYAQTSSSYAALKSLVIDLLNYATAARTYFGYTEGLAAPDAPFNSILSAEDQVVTWTEDLIKAEPVCAEPDVTFTKALYGKNVNLLDAISLSYFFLGTDVEGVMYWTEDDFAASSVHDSLSCTGEANLTKAASYVTGKITGIFAYNIYDNYYVRAYDAEGNLSEAYGASIASYLKQVLDKYGSSTNAEEMALVALAKAMMVYGNNASTNSSISRG